VVFRADISNAASLWEATSAHFGRCHDTPDFQNEVSLETSERRTTTPPVAGVGRVRSSREPRPVTHPKSSALPYSPISSRRRERNRSQASARTAGVARGCASALRLEAAKQYVSLPALARIAVEDYLSKRKPNGKRARIRARQGRGPGDFLETRPDVCFHSVARLRPRGMQSRR
jgi:hypothetical protein